MPQKAFQTISKLSSSEIDEVCQWVNENYQLAIDVKNGKYFGCIYRRHDTPSGCERWLLWASFNQGHATPQEAGRAVNEQLKGLSFAPGYAELVGIPQDALSLLHPVVIKVDEHVLEKPVVERQNEGV